MNRTLVLDLAKSDFKAELVLINTNRIHEIQWPAVKNAGMTIELPWCDASNPSGALMFLVAMGSLNFRFWQVNENGELDRYKRESKTGARALWAAFQENWDGNSFAFKERLKDGMTGISWIFGDIPFPKQRLQILEHVFEANKLCDVCRALSAEIIESGKVTIEHASTLAKTFPLAFDDSYLKKAQLALSMYAGYLKGVGHNVEVNDLVAFADYQVPRVLRALQVISYSPSLSAKVDSGILIGEDSPEEKAIRAATILACENIAEFTGSTSADVDNWLWQAQDVAGDSRFHLTPTTRY